MFTSERFRQIPFASERDATEALYLEGWRRATKHTWFRVVSGFIEFVTCSPDRDGDKFTGGFIVTYQGVQRFEVIDAQPLAGPPPEAKKPKVKPKPEPVKEVEIVHVKRRTTCF